MASSRPRRESLARDAVPGTEASERRGWKPGLGMPEVAGVVGLVALIALVVFSQLSNGASSGRSVLPNPPLSWTRGTFLPGIGYGPPIQSADDWIAASDGNTAYACAPNTSGASPTVAAWVTHDRAVHWQHLSDLPSLASDDVSCWMEVDTLDPARAVLDIGAGLNADGSAPQRGLAYLTADGGWHWRRLTSPALYQYSHFATIGSVTLALTSPDVAISRDGMRTWQPIDGAIRRAGQGAQTYWIRPETGELLVIGCYEHRFGCYLWRSDNLGASWSRITSEPYLMLTVQRPIAGKPWVGCGITLVTTTRPVKAQELECSMDGFKTWPIHQMMAQAILASGASPLPCASDEAPEYFLLAITPKNTALVGCSSGEANVYDNALYAFSLTTRRWTSLGAYPTLPNQTLTALASQTIIYTTAAGQVVLWSFPYNFDPLPEDDPLFSATYPDR